jgi:hypothetical protein
LQLAKEGRQSSYIVHIEPGQIRFILSNNVRICVYRAMPKLSKQLPNYLKIAGRFYRFIGVLCHIRAYTVTVSYCHPL